MRSSLGRLCALATFAAGCSVPLQEASPSISNTCAQAQDCGAGATCIETRNGSRACAATSADLGGLLLDVRPPVSGNGMGTGNAVVGGGAYLVEASTLGQRLAGSALGGVIDLDVALPALVSLQKGRINAFAKDDACATAAGESIPAEVFFSRTTPHVGLPVGEYKTSTEFAATEEAPNGQHVFATALPAGRYDVYVRPRTPEGCLGLDEQQLPDLPPYLIRGLEIGAEAGQINIDLPQRQTLTGTVDSSAALSVEGWTVSMIDRATAKLISTEPELVNVEFGFPSAFQVEFHPTKIVTGEEGPGKPAAPFPLVRVRAPEADGYTPALLGALDELDLDGNYDVALTLGKLSKAVDVEASILTTDTLYGVAATVTFVSDFSKGLRFERTLTTKADGSFQTSLITASAELPGQYQCFARPIDDSSPEAIGTVDWQINPGEDFVGHTLVLPPRAVVSGSVLTAADQKLDAEVTAAQSARNNDPISPRAVQGLISDGALAVSLDPGTFDLVVKPAEGSGFPWLVTSQLEILDQQAVALGVLRIPNPIVLRGRVLDADNQPVPLAAMTAWLPVEDEDASTSTVVQVGQTVSDEAGEYTLFLPPSLTH
ncbi:MAG: hypothetical protein WKG00_01835 [Polyangiaceae bacterium]